MSKTPIFPMPEPNLYSDYGFDPQIDFFRDMEETRRRSKRSEPARPIDSLRFKLQKPISKDDAKSKKRRRWWKSALGLFWKRPRTSSSSFSSSTDDRHDIGGVCLQSYHLRPASLPTIYTTGSGNCGGAGGSWEAANTACYTSSRPSSGGLMAAEAGVAYFSVGDLSGEDGHQIPSSAGPIYLVT